MPVAGKEEEEYLCTLDDLEGLDVEGLKNLMFTVCGKDSLEAKFFCLVVDHIQEGDLLPIFILLCPAQASRGGHSLACGQCKDCNQCATTRIVKAFSDCVDGFTTSQRK